MASRVHKISHLWASQAREQALGLKAKRDRVRNDRRRKRRIVHGMGGLQPEHMTINELRAYARECEIPGRSKMKRDDLVLALNRHLGI